MQKLGLRPEKREKDRQRMVKLARIITKKPIKSTEPMEKILKLVHKTPKTPAKKIWNFGKPRTSLKNTDA